MTIIDNFHCQAKIFYAGNNKLKNGLTLFEIAEGIHNKMPELATKDIYSFDKEAFAFDRQLILDAVRKDNFNEDEKTLLLDLYKLFIETENGFFGKPTYKTEAKYFVIHAGTYNHD